MTARLVTPVAAEGGAALAVSAPVLEGLPDRQRGAGSSLACRAPDVDPDWWFPGDSVTAARAKRVCAACPLRLPCLAVALARNEQFGVWGGLTETERRPLPRPHPCRRCGTPTSLSRVYCGDDCRGAARAEVTRRSDRRRRLRAGAAR
jgi:hypothetical protein